MKKWLKIVAIVFAVFLAATLVSALIVFGLSGDGGANSIELVDRARAAIDNIKPIALLFRVCLYSIIVLKGYQLLLPKRKDEDGTRQPPKSGDIMQSKLLLVVVCILHEVVIVQRLFLV